MSGPEEGKLSKDEVESLLDRVGDENAAAEKAQSSRRVHGYDFQQPSRFGKSQLEHLRGMNEGLAQNAAQYASRVLRSNVKAQLVSMDQMKWENLLEDAGDAVVAFVFLMEGLGQRGIVIIDNRFAVAALDRMMGGQAELGDDAPIELTDLDVRVLAGFVRALLEPLPDLWANIGQFSVQLGSFVQDLQALDLFPSGEDFVQFTFLLHGNVGSGQIVLAAPFEAVRELPPEPRQAESGVTATTDEATDRALRESLKRTRVDLSVLLGTTDVMVADLVQVTPGDVIVLDTRVGDALDIRVNDKVKLRGYPGVANGRLAAKLITGD